MEPVFRLRQGHTPLLISMPHTGTAIPVGEQHRYVERALGSEDTDWHLERLYGGLAGEFGASLIVPHHSRYLIDLNRPPDDAPMYPGASNTELCPTRFFSGDALYRDGQAPTAAERLQRRETFWQPYHAALQAELDRLRARFGYVLLFDAHSIRSEVPWLFAGRLPDLNLGTVDGSSCAPSITAALGAVQAAQTRYTQVCNGRFKGGYITRHYGKPALGQHAVQMEIAQRCYMREAPPFDYHEADAAALQSLLRTLLATLLEWTP